MVTIALGSTLSTDLLSKDVALAEGVLAMALLIGLQYAVATLIAHSDPFGRLVKSEPTLLYRTGFLTGAMRRARVGESNLRQVARTAGHPDLDSVAAMVLESDGSISVLTAGPVVLG